MTQRIYDDELRDNVERQYAYRFDSDVMSPLMVRSMKPYFVDGKLLELGSHYGGLTSLLIPHFASTTCIDASLEAIQVAKARVNGKADFLHGRFEEVTPPSTYENVIMVHALEHVDDPQVVLERVNRSWLAEHGRFFVICPNANAPSRQIAVRMGLISHNSAVTQGEREHGHRCTYTFDVLERDVRNAGLIVEARFGIFFKAFANFQWDKLLTTDIVSPEYLEGCYQLGMVYPDLCSSIALVCRKGPRT